MKMSLVIRCYNEEQHIRRLLHGVMEQSVKGDVEIIVVDSGSTDGTLDIVSQFPTKLLTIRPEEFTFGRSLNRGCEAATGDVIAIASAHVYPRYKDWLERMVEPFSDPQVAVSYGCQRGDASTKYSEHQLLARWFPHQSNPRQDHPFCNNANAAIRRPVWEQLRYDETLTGLEDIDCAKKAMELDYYVAYVAEAEVVHVHNESPNGIYNRYRREAIALKRIFPLERFSLWDFACLFVANTASDYRHAWQERLLRRKIGEIFIFRLMQLWGTYRGFKLHGPVSGRLKSTFYYPNHRFSRQSAPDKSERLIEYADLVAKPGNHPPESKETN